MEREEADGGEVKGENWRKQIQHGVPSEQNLVFFSLLPPSSKCEVVSVVLLQSVKLTHTHRKHTLARMDGQTHTKTLRLVLINSTLRN